MVTILEPQLEVSVEPVPLPEEVQPKGGYLEWRYTMPFAGVRYYSFRPNPVAGNKALKPAEAEPVRLAAQLIDERVILL